MQNRQETTTIQARSSEAARLYQRGMAAARAGQRRVAVALLTRSVKLDPSNEGAWLWLSGVLDDPRQAIFCLQSVLKLNPNNERARRGLRWLQDRHSLQGQVMDSAALPDVSTLDMSQRQKREQSDSWWVNWRQGHRDSRRSMLMLWAIPIILLSLALVIHQSFALAAERSSQPAAVAVVLKTMADLQVQAPQLLAAAQPTAQPEVLPTTSPIFESAPHSIRESQTIIYLETLTPIRQRLSDAVNAYRNVTGKPGGALTHMAAARDLQSSVQQAYDELHAMEPPSGLQAGHETYLKGLEVELAAIEDLLEFYGSYRVELANRAAIRFQEANGHFDQARAMFNARLQQIRDSSTVSPHTMR